MALVDVIAPPDFILNSPIGKADGEVRERIHRHTCAHEEEDSPVLHCDCGITYCRQMSLKAAEVII